MQMNMRHYIMPLVTLYNALFGIPLFIYLLRSHVEIPPQAFRFVG